MLCGYHLLSISFFITASIAIFMAWRSVGGGGGGSFWPQTGIYAASAINSRQERSMAIN
jgi:hypothetical protein